MDYRYDGNFKPEETGYKEYRPIGTARYFYCDVFPGTANENTGEIEYSKRAIRVRIIPCSTDSVFISGWNGVYDIYPFNEKYALLDNAFSNENPRRMALISMYDIRNCFLSIKER